MSGRSAEPSQGLLEKKIAKRTDKEFPNPHSEEQDILRELKDKYLKFVPCLIKQQRDGEFFVQIGQNVREKDVHVFHKFSDKNLDLMELLTMGDALLRAGVRSVTLYLPYIPYQRQDKKDEGRVPISSKLVFNLLKASLGNHLKRIVTFDLHARQAQAHFDGPLDELSAVPEFAAYYRKQFENQIDADPYSVIVISPDAGGAKRANRLAELLGTYYQVLDKKRVAHGEARTNYYLDLDVQWKKVILIDDMIDSGSSLVGEQEHEINGPVQYLQSRGAEVYICATHAVLSEKNGLTAEQRLRKAKVPVLFTNSLPEKHPGYYKQNADWMKIISIDYVLAKAFYCNQVGESISEFLKKREEKLLSKKLDLIAMDEPGEMVGVE